MNTKFKELGYEKRLSDVAIEFDDVFVSYTDPKTTVLRNFNLKIGKGEVVSLLGRSGVGKTTVLKTIAGLNRIDKGYIRVNGQLVSSSFVHVAPEKRRVGYMFQDYALFPHMTVEKNVAFGAGMLPKSERKDTIEKALELVDIAELRNRLPNQLSGGQQQRVACARSLAAKPLVLLLDEPFSNLDGEMRNTMHNKIRQIANETKITMLIVSHNRRDVLNISDKIGVVCAGTVAQYGDPIEVYKYPCTSDVAKLCGPCNFVSGTYKSGMALTPAGSFKLSSLVSKHFTDGEKLTLLIRPNDVDIHLDESSPIMLKSQLFTGDVMEHTVKLPNDQLLNVSKLNLLRIRDGVNVKITPREGVELVAYKRS